MHTLPTASGGERDALKSDRRIYPAELLLRNQISDEQSVAASRERLNAFLKYIGFLFRIHCFAEQLYSTNITDNLFFGGIFQK